MLKMRNIFILFALLAFTAACTKPEGVSQEAFGTLSDGTAVTVFHIQNGSGASMDVIDYGCRVVSIYMPDRTGRMDDVVVGPGDIETF